MAGSTGGDTGRLFLTFVGAGLHRTNGISLLDKILTYKNLIYLLNFLIIEILSQKFKILKLIYQVY